MPTDVKAYNRQLIEEFRTTSGASAEGRPLLLLTTVGARSGQPHTAPMMYVADGDRLVVIASNNGAAADPQWYRNLVANPDVTVEVGAETYPATATVAEGDERARLWATIVASYPFFAEHQEKADERQIPVVALAQN